MLKKLLCLLIGLFLISGLSAQPYVLQVIVESAFIRAAPAFDAEAIASVFENDSLIAVGRNIDGEWLEVRRPAYQNKVGWINREVISVTFDIGLLPITDLTTGLVGTQSVIDTGYSVMTISAVPLFTTPDRFSQEIETIPVFRTVPVIGRTPNLQWFQVNYRGNVGWIQQFLTMSGRDFSEIPISPEYAEVTRYQAFGNVSKEVQLAQIERFLNYVRPLKETADHVSNYWQLMTIGETLECKPLEPTYTYYATTPNDIREFPELRHQERLVKLGVDDLNTSITAMRPCGIRLQNEIRVAYAKALNAAGIFEMLIKRMEELRDRIS